MGTLVSFHAHPDDECLGTGGTMARAAAEGHRVVLVVATNGDHGEVPDDLADGETIVDRRRLETERSAAVLGIHRIVWLGYSDSGMTGWPQNADPGSFLRADDEQAAGRLAAILREEGADVLTVYDWHGGYGHPDHVKIHRVGHRAAVLGETPGVFESTMNRDALVRFMQTASDPEALAGPNGEFDPTGPMDDGNPLGTPESELTHAVDVNAFVGQKRRSLMCHASQVTDTGYFLTMPDDAFTIGFGTEWFIKRDDPGPLREGWLFE